VDVTGDNATGMNASVFQFTGADTNTADPLKQAKTSATTAANPTLTFDAAMNTLNGYAAGFGMPRNPPTSTAPTSWTETSDTGYGTPTSGASTAYRAGGETGSTVTFTSSSAAYGMVAVEVYADGYGPGPFNCSTVGSPTYQAGKFSNSAGTFTTGNYFNCPAGANTFTAALYTLQAWVKTSSTDWQAIVAIGTTGTTQAYIYISTGGLPTCWQGNGAGVTSSSIADGNWHLITCGTNGSTNKLFVDGTYIGSAATSATVPNLAWRIGLNNTTNDPSDGEIDEISFWGTELYGTTSFTPPTSAYCGDEANLVALYHLDSNGNDSKGSSCGAAQSSQGYVRGRIK
jgi:hypothetical protein